MKQTTGKKLLYRSGKICAKFLQKYKELSSRTQNRWNAKANKQGCYLIIPSIVGSSSANHRPFLHGLCIETFTQCNTVIFSMLFKLAKGSLPQYTREIYQVGIEQQTTHRPDVHSLLIRCHSR